MLLETPKVNKQASLLEFKLSDAHGKSFSLDDVRGDNGTLIAFICNHCPYVIAIMERFVLDAKKLTDAGIGVVAINSNDYSRYPADSPGRMIDFSKSYGMDFPYLVDEDQSVARGYGAVCTPDFFGFNKKGNLEYRGRLDDAKMNDPTNRKEELVSAMLEISKNAQGPQEQFSSMGCSIKWK